MTLQLDSVVKNENDGYQAGDTATKIFFSRYFRLFLCNNYVTHASKVL